MDMDVVNIPLDAEFAKIYKSTTAENQRKIQALLSLWLREIRLIRFRYSGKFDGYNQ